MVQRKRRPEAGLRTPGVDRRPVARRVRDQPRLVEQLVPIEYALATDPGLLRGHRHDCGVEATVTDCGITGSLYSPLAGRPALIQNLPHRRDIEENR